MRYFFKVVRAEMLKQHKHYFHNKSIYVSLFLWPIITFISAYYNYTPFNLDFVSIGYLNKNNMIVFVLIGYTCLIFFNSLVQSAWNFSFERIHGTLELIYLSPANRFAFILGNALSALFGSVWLFLVFTGGVIMLKGSYLDINLASAAVGFTLLMLLSVLWGMLLNSLFLFSRDSGFLFTILQEPMEILSGVKVPAVVFPVWAKILGAIFPLTYSVEVLRRALLKGETLSEMIKFIIVSLLIALVMLLLTIVCLKLGERHARKTGNMALF